MVSAICPLCHIILVEATSASTNNLGTAVNTAVSLGAKFVSNSYGGGESSSETSTDTSFYNHPGVAVTASSGDGGFGPEYPAASRFVTAVGGTSLTRASNSRGWTETAWSGAGSGCSSFETKPTWQKDTGCSRRTIADVSAVADPNTGVAVYDTEGGDPGFEVFGGTSVASPIMASVFALAGTPTAGTYPSSYPYSHTSSLNDVTSGSNGSCSPSYLCTAGPGYDGPTGLGTPNGTGAFHQ
jgi:subtilase family serine protease